MSCSVRHAQELPSTSAGTQPRTLRAVTLLMFGFIAGANAGGEIPSDSTGATYVGAPAQEIRDQLQRVKDARMRQLLERFYALPDLLALAKEKSSPNGDPYPEQERLSKEYNGKQLAYRLSMPQRHRAKCKSGEHPVAAIQYTLADPRHGTRVQLWEVDIHEALVHGAVLPEPVAKFLEGLK